MKPSRMAFFSSISDTLNAHSRLTGLGLARCGQCEANQTENHRDHEGVATVPMRTEH